MTVEQRRIRHGSIPSMPSREALRAALRCSRRAPPRHRTAISCCSRTARAGPTARRTRWRVARPRACVAWACRPGDKVLVWLPNGPDAVRAWFGINLAGACYAPLNIAYRGRLLAHAIEQSGARVMVVHAGLVERLQEIPATQLETLIVVGERPAGFDWPGTVVGVEVLDERRRRRARCGRRALGSADDDLHVRHDRPVQGRAVHVPADPHHGLRAVRLHERRRSHPDRPADVPHRRRGFDHRHARRRAAPPCCVESFSTERFWERVQRFRATTTSGLIGSMPAFLAKLPPRDDDKDNTAAASRSMPLTRQAMDLAQRHGFHYCSGFNMTELSVPLVTDVDTTVPGSCGRPRTGCECRIVDANDIECPPGVTGELIVRNDLPWTTSLGYINQPEANARAWRNGWFHTGDLLYRDEAGDFFFVDRLKDAIRRRGENISSMEVEAEVLCVPGRRRSGGRRRAERGRRGGSAGRRGACARRRSRSMPPSCVRFLDAAHAALHGAALRARHGVAAEDADQQDPQGRDPPAGRHGRLLGPRRAAASRCAGRSWVELLRAGLLRPTTSAPSGSSRSSRATSRSCRRGTP